MLFHEIYGSYMNVVAKVLGLAVEGKLTKENIYEIINEKAFGESIVTIPDALLSQKWPLIDEEFATPLKYKPTLPLTDLQKMWLKAIMVNPRLQLFDLDMSGLEDVEPLFERDAFVFFDQYADGDPYEDERYREHFRCILQGIKEKRKLYITYHGKGGRHNQVFLPEKLEYSSKDDKFRMLGISEKGVPFAINLARISRCVLEDAFDWKDYARVEVKKESVVFELVDERNALERVMLHFSDLEKETTKLDDMHYRIKLDYRVEDETEILIRILSFGARIWVVEPTSFIELIKERLDKQEVANLDE